MLHSWFARVGCEGGPLLLCDAEAFAAWGGAVLDDDYELDPACDLHRATNVLHPSDDEELEAGAVRFGPHERHTGLVWQMDGAGTAEVATAGDTGVLVMRSWVRNTDAPHRYTTGPAAPSRERPAGGLDLPSGRLAVVWAPVAAADVTGLDSPTVPARLDVDHLVGIGTLLRVRPGRYLVRHGSLEGTRGRYAPAEEHHGPPVPAGDADWSCRWLRLTHTGG